MSGRPWLTGSVVLLFIALAAIVPPTVARATTGACSHPSTAYGTDTLTVNIPATGNYYIWSRLAADSSADNNFMMQIDNSACYTVGTSPAKSVPIYANGASNLFMNNSSNWLNTDTSGNLLIASGITSGSHTVEIIGNSPNLAVDRLILTQDSHCIPTGTGDNCAALTDTTPPTVGITSPSNGATLVSTTNITASASDDVGVTKVEFYIDGSLKATDTASPYTYSLSPTDLTIGQHQLTAKAYDAAGNSAMSTIVTFTIPDTTAPTVSLTAPSSGASVSGTITAAASASDDVGVTKVEFYVDGSLKATDITATGISFSTSLATLSLSNGSHTVLAKAYDAAGNSATSSAAVTINNPVTPPADTTPPTVSLTSPVNGSFVNNDSSTRPYSSQAYSVNALAADTSGIAHVVFELDGTIKATDTTAPYTYNLNLSNLSCGAHTIKAIATDASGNANTATSSASFTTTYAENIVTSSSCHVTYLDLSALASKYGQSGASLGRADINGDGVINYLDLSALASKYGR